MVDAHQRVIPVFITHMGCPNDCAFCNQKHITGIEKPIEPEHLSIHIDRYLETMSNQNVGIAFYGGSFTGISVTLQDKYLQVAKDYKDQGRINTIRLSTRPDYVDDAVLERLKRYSVDLVELGCQSFNDSVLQNAQRGHGVQHNYDAIACLKRHKMAFGIQLMPGLNGDTYETASFSVAKAIELEPQCVRIYPTVVIKNTLLEDQFSKGVYEPWSLEQAVSFCTEAFKAFVKKGIAVIRLGLQTSETIHFGGNVVAGPFHPAFGALVLSELYYRAITKHLISEGVYEIKVHPSHRMYLAGQGKMNLDRWKPKVTIKGISDSRMPLYSFQINGQEFVNIME